jgi:glycosyltransferase involved in cell wall biosynthesis
MSPSVSVVLPTVNAADKLLRSVNSVLEQTYRDLELIVVDDGSADDTPSAIRDLKDARIKYIRLARNRGQSVARNIGVSESKGALIAFQDSDDIWQRDKLARQVDILRDPDLGGVYCDLLRIPLTGKPFIIEAPNVIRGAMFDRRPSLYQSYAIGIQSCLLRKEALERVGLFREDMRCFEDLEFLLRFSIRYRMHRIPEPLVKYFESNGVSMNSAATAHARILLFRRYGYRAAFANRKAWLKELKFYLRGADGTTVTWAKSLDMELKELRRIHARTVTDHEVTAARARSLDKELDDLRSAHARTVADHENTVTWAKSLDKELDGLRSAHARTVADHENTVAWAKSLDKELDDLRSAHARTVADHGTTVARAKSLSKKHSDLPEQEAGRSQFREQELFAARRRIELLERDAALAHAMLASNSWRLTRPLRFAARVVRGDWRAVRASVRPPLLRAAQAFNARLKELNSTCKRRGSRPGDRQI